MDFRRLKLYLTLGIAVTGMLIALAWHGWMGSLGLGYPYNTFLFIPNVRFSDFTDPLKSAGMLSPYQDHFSEYFPFTYGLLSYLRFLDPATAVRLFLNFTCTGMGVALVLALRPLFSNWVITVLVSAVMLACSYPFLLCIDRANLELLLVLCMAAALLCFRGRHWIPGLAFLLPAICLKFYPVLLLGLFIRPRHWLKPLIVGVLFVIISVGYMASFGLTIDQNWNLWCVNFDFYKNNYVLHNCGFAGSASPWNTVKALLVMYYGLANPLFDADRAYLPLDLLTSAYQIYSVCAAVIFLSVIAYAILVEREFFRRAILLLLVATMAAPSSGDYKLLTTNVALVAMILLPGRRPLDLWITVLLACLMVPKKEIFLPSLGFTDSGFHDIPISILINPPCILAAIGLLVWDGFQPGTLNFVQHRFFGILMPIRKLVVANIYQPKRRPKPQPQPQLKGKKKRKKLKSRS